MDELYGMCRTVAIVTVVSGVIVALVPKGKLKGAVNTFSVIVVLYSFIYPLSNFKTSTNNISDSFITQSRESYDDNTIDMLLYLSEAELEAKAESILKENSFNTVCDIILSEVDNKAKIEQITVSGNFTQAEKYEITNILHKEFNNVIKIEFAG